MARLVSGKAQLAEVSLTPFFQRKEKKRKNRTATNTLSAKFAMIDFEIGIVWDLWLEVCWTRASGGGTMSESRPCAWAHRDTRIPASTMPSIISFLFSF